MGSLRVDGEFTNSSSQLDRVEFCQDLTDLRELFDEFIEVSFSSSPDFHTISRLWSPLVLTPREDDVLAILREAIEPNLVRFAIDRIRKRLGGLRYQQAQEYLAADRKEELVDLLLPYYDKTYAHQMKDRDVIHRFEMGNKSLVSIKTVVSIFY